MTSPIVGPSATAIESAKKGIPRLAFTEPSTGSTTTQRRAAVAEAALAELLGDERERLPARMQPLQPLDDLALGRLVDGGGVVAADTGPEDRLAVGPCRQPVEDLAQVADGAAALLEPVDHTGWNSRPVNSLG